MMKGQLAGLMKQAQAMQDNLKKAQDELANIEVEGQSGAGLVKVTMTCKHDVKRISIDPSLVGDISTAEPVEPGRPFLPAARGWITKDRSQPGHIGHPQAASAEKGETLLSRFTDDTCALLERVTSWDGSSWNG